ncbi:unnamed protein product [Mytilus coruscus]|uniref:Uncharacterized protein n=1 Tax=Mytilus coruscus TaxID=42192 RepID=A0A6J8DK90_MYTCO|nr:unnamed protein product [Mytilus coruscus]
MNKGFVGFTSKIYLFVSTTHSYRIQCPDISQRSLRASGYCTSSFKSHYTCLYDTNNFSFFEQCIEDPDYVKPGEKYVITGSLRNVDCSKKRYQPFSLWSNVSGECLYQKSLCKGDGQVVFDNGSSTIDRKCRCDFTKGYKFVQRPVHICFCIPSEEDCSCNIIKCDVDRILSSDYECVEESQHGNSTCPPIENKSNSSQSPKIKRCREQQRREQLSNGVIVNIGVIVLIMLCAVMVFIVLWTKRQLSEREKDNRLKKYIVFSEEWNELTKATYKKNLSKVKKELLKDVNNSDMTISMKIACIAGYTSIVKVLSPQFILKNLTTLDDEGNTPLLCASIAGKLSIVKLFLKNVNDSSNKGQTPLMNASRYGFLEIVDLLLTYGAEVNVQNEMGESPLSLACQHDRGDVEVVKILLTYGAKVNVQNAKGETPLILACQSDRINVIKKLIEAEADVTICNNAGVSALMYACGNGTLNAVRILNRTKCSVNDVDKAKRSTLLHACSSLSPTYLYETLNIKKKIVAILSGTSKSVWSKRRSVVIRFLINNNANVNMEDERGVTPLMLACRAKCEISVDLLLKNKAEINATDNINSSNALLWAMQGNPDIHMINIIKMLVRKDADVNIIDANKNTSLMNACYKIIDVNRSEEFLPMINASRDYCVQIVDLLLRNGVDVNAKNKFDETSLIVACKGDHVDIIEKLVNAGADLERDAFNAFCAACEYGSFESVKILYKFKTLDIIDSSDRSLLFHACSALHFKSVCSPQCTSLIGFIIGKYGDVNRADNRGITPLMLACQNNCPKAVEELLANAASINAADEIDGSTVLAWAMRWKSKYDIIAVIKILVNKHADAHKSNYQGFSPVMLACESNDKKIIQVFIDNVQDEDKLKPLRVACQNSLKFLYEQAKNPKEQTCPVKSLTVDIMITIIADLVKYKRIEIQRVLEAVNSQNDTDYFENENKDDESDRNAINDNNSSDNELSPLLKAFEINNMNIVRLLIEGNVDVNKCNGSNVTPLMKACELDESYIDILKLLIKKTKDINARNNEGQTALFITCNKRNPSFKIVKSLFEEQSRNPKLYNW